MALGDLQHPDRQLPRHSGADPGQVPSIRVLRWGSSRASSSASSADSASTAKARTARQVRGRTAAGQHHPAQPGVPGQRATTAAHRASRHCPLSVSSDSVLSTTISTRRRSSSSVSPGKNAASLAWSVQQVHHLQARVAPSPG